ncbi:MAG: NAD(P)/FAD-dependent oxidoreductase [Alphaproteobacteria bacterium]|nr:NAD(P)/FAD-dependent oxidoreductase [Alphaproteobacteria bacterium]
MEKIYDVIIIGAGASGCFCASQISSDKSVMIIDANEKKMRKVFVSGGGRCNFTNVNANEKYYLSNNNKFCISALKQFSPTDFINLVDLNNIEYYEKHKGQMFCKNSSLEIINLINSKTGKNVKFFMKTRVLYSLKKENLFQIKTNKGLFKSKSLVIASGGNSFPKLGASDIGYKIAESFNIPIIETKPALVGLKSEYFRDISGISLPVKIKVNKREINDDILFTHKGISGPATLKASLFIKDKMFINFYPEKDIFDYLKTKQKDKPRSKAETVLKELLPTKFVSFILSETDTPELANISDKALRLIANKINNFEFKFNGTVGYETAEITSGGVDTKSISSQTMESQTTPNLFFIGEVLDVSGYLGGYNLQWAWSSAFVCAKEISKDI